jgi:hypothetical protein
MEPLSGVATVPQFEKRSEAIPLLVSLQHVPVIVAHSLHA